MHIFSDAEKVAKFDLPTLPKPDGKRLPLSSALRE